MPFRPAILCFFMGSTGQRDSVEAGQASVGIFHRQRVRIRDVFYLALCA
jgi:hypothetical protein